MHAHISPQVTPLRTPTRLLSFEALHQSVHNCPRLECVDCFAEGSRQLGSLGSPAAAPAARNSGTVEQWNSGIQLSPELSRTPRRKRRRLELSVEPLTSRFTPEGFNSPPHCLQTQVKDTSLLIELYLLLFIVTIIFICVNTDAGSDEDIGSEGAAQMSVEDELDAIYKQLNKQARPPGTRPPGGSALWRGGHPIGSGDGTHRTLGGRSTRWERAPSIKN
eukprot:8511728-Pyramimonas_sp.AAC.1